MTRPHGLERLALPPRPPRRIRTALAARSLRAGIVIARGAEFAPGGWVDFGLVDRAYLRTRIRAASRRLSHRLS